MENKIRTIALVAHNNCKQDLYEWVEYNKDTLNKFNIVSTKHTGEKLQYLFNNKINCVPSGEMGGDQVVGSMIVNKEIDCLFFFWDPKSPHPHDVDIKALLRVAVTYNILSACNRKTADYIISSPLFK